MSHSLTGGPGRLCNQVIRNVAASIMSKKFDLYTLYYRQETINKLGIILHIGNNRYNSTVIIKNDNFIDYLKNDVSNHNINVQHDYFQTEEITNLVCAYLRSDEQKVSVINANPFKTRYNNNDDLFIHIRLGDVERENPGITYYRKCIEKVLIRTTIYIGTDSPAHPLIKQLVLLYNDVIVVDYDETQTIQFGSTCSNVILSHGSYSGVIGYLSYYAKNIYYPGENRKNGWCPRGMFTDKGWYGC